MREGRIAQDCIKRFELDLRGLRVFTEAATGTFAWTPVIALLANAEFVYAIAKDSRFGSKEQARNAVEGLAAAHTCDERLRVVYDYDEIGQADVVTNLGSVRPISRDVVSKMRSHAVIPLMWETWEFREQDVDIQACSERGILMLGTNEHDPGLNTFSYLGLLAIKLLLEAGLEIYHSRILVVGGGDFGHSVLTNLLMHNVFARTICGNDAIKGEMRQSVIAESLGDSSAISFLEEADAIVFAEHNSERLLVGDGGDLTVERLSELNKDLRIVHISGLLDVDDLRTRGFSVVPQAARKVARTMTVTLSYLGPKPVLELHTAGLKVGEVMARSRGKHADVTIAKSYALQHSLASDFSEVQKAKYGLF